MTKASHIRVWLHSVRDLAIHKSRVVPKTKQFKAQTHKDTKATNQTTKQTKPSTNKVCHTWQAKDEKACIVSSSLSSSSSPLLSWAWSSSTDHQRAHTGERGDSGWSLTGTTERGGMRCTAWFCREIQFEFWVDPIRQVNTAHMSFSGRGPVHGTHSHALIPARKHIPQWWKKQNFCVLGPLPLCPGTAKLARTVSDAGVGNMRTFWGRAGA